MKKKILILIMCVCMIVPMFAVVSFADTASALVDNWNYQYGVVQGTLYNHGSGGTDNGSSSELRFGGGIGNARAYIHLTSGALSYEFDTLHYEYDYLTFSVGSDDVDRIHINLQSNSGTSVYTLKTGLDTLNVSINGEDVVSWNSLNEPIKFTVVLLYNDSAIMAGDPSDFFGYIDDTSDTEFRLISNSYTAYMGNNYHVDQPKNLISLLMGSIGITGIGLAGGIKESVSNLIYVDPTAETKTLSNFAIFIFIIAGLSIAMTVFWLVFRLIRFGRQR